MKPTDVRPIKRALLSVSDKSGIESLARALDGLGVEMLSTGGTHRAISAAGVAVAEVQAHTQFPEMMDGRVKTLHPRIHGGILGRRGTDDAIMAEHGIEPIDLVVVNLYPFEATVSKPDCTREDAVENIDIGGPAMVRSAAKNHKDVVVVVDPADYDVVIAACRTQGGVDAVLRSQLAAKAFRHTAAYDAAVAGYLDEDPFPEQLTMGLRKLQSMRYGENPHQSAAFYRESQVPAGTIAAAVQLQGKALSYNNVADTDAALECVKAFDAPTCVIVKHANPCGVASAESIVTAYDRAFAADTTSAFGGIVAFNRTLDGPTAQRVLDTQFAEVLIAPGVTDEAAAAAKKKKNVRLLDVGELSSSPASNGPVRFDWKRVGGGMLVQEADTLELDADSGLQVVSQREPTTSEVEDLQFAWRVAWFVKSNAIVYARDRQTIGVGAGQMARVISARIANLKADDEGLPVAGAVMASDAFFPFRDGIDAAASVGITCVIQPGGSMRDAEVIGAADEHGMAMVFTGVRHFRH